MNKTYVLLLSILLLFIADDVSAQLKLGDQPTSVQKSVILDLQGSNGRQGVWLPRISDTSDATGIDALNPPDGVLIYHTGSSQVMIRKNGYWSSLQTNVKVGSTTSSNSTIELQLGTAAGATKDLNLALSAGTGVITLNVPDATVDTRGVVTINSQTFGGVKTFNDGLTSLSATTISGASSNASNLYLGVTSATTPGTTTDRVLSVDNTGRVVLSQSIPTTRTMTINGTAYDLSANRTWSVGTVTGVTGGYGLSGGTINTSGTLAVDSALFATKAWRQKGIDSVAALLGSYLPANRTLTINGTTYDLSANRTWSVGTVTGVTGGYGLSGGTISASGTLAVDSALFATKAWRQKGIDSVVGILGNYVPVTRTLNGLALSSNQTFATGSAGTDFAISSSGTTHTFNLPTASATNRGLLSAADWTTFNNKLSTSRTLTINGTTYDLSANRTWNVGTVTGVTGGYGLSGGTISASGTLAVDSALFSTKAWRQKGIDSVVGILGNYVPVTRTLNGLALSSNQTFATGSAGTDFTISSSGTTHTFNLPTASATNRGLLSAADWTTFNSKLSSSRTLTINGTTYDLSANRTWNVGTVTGVTGGYGLSGGTISASGTLAVDSALFATKAWRQKGIDSVVGILGNYLSSSRTLTINGTTYDLSANRTWNVGTVTSVAPGYGITGSTITTTGTHGVDTGSIATRLWRQKGIDSVVALMNTYVPKTTSINGLALSFNHTFSTGSSGTDFNIVSGGSTHTFNIPTASATNRGLLSSGDWTTFNNKVSSTRTINGLALSNNQTFATGTSGTDFNISSSGTTHTFNVPDASGSARGVITTGTQTFAGAKTFSTGVTVSGATSNASNLTLGITSATTPGTATDRYLTVDATGKVILSSVSGITGLTTIGASPNANGASISGGLLSLQPASATFGGIVTTGTQTFEGDKTFDNTVSAKVALQAGTATAGTAPLKFTSGTNLTTPENGAVEYNGTNYFVTSGGTRFTLARTLTASSTLDFPATAGFGSNSTLNITVNGAADGDVVSLGVPSAAHEDGGSYYAYVSAANTVTIVFTNSTWFTLNPASGTFKVSVQKF